MLHHANSRITLELSAQSNVVAKLDAQRDMVGTWGLEPQTSTVSNKKRDAEKTELPNKDNNLK
jgi:hypothetical protein